MELRARKFLHGNFQKKENFLHVEHFRILKFAGFDPLVWTWARRSRKRSRRNKIAAKPQTQGQRGEAGE